MDKKGVIPLDYNVFKDNTEKIILITNSNKTYPSHIQKIDFECYDTLFKTLYSLDIRKYNSARDKIIQVLQNFLKASPLLNNSLLK